jgi:hypothetical protein
VGDPEGNHGNVLDKPVPGFPVFQSVNISLQARLNKISLHNTAKRRDPSLVLIHLLTAKIRFCLPGIGAMGR